MQSQKAYRSTHTGSEQALRNILLALLLLFVLPTGAQDVLQQSTAAINKPVVRVISINGAIGPATSDYVARNLELAAADRVRLVVLAIDTPGGLDASMREIIRAILDSPVPVVSYVSPQGARAASAGTYILYASHIAAMAPATNLGAATPVQIDIGLPKPPTPGSKDKEDAEPQGSAMEKKVVNDATAYIRGLAELRGRNSEWAEKAVRQGSSLPAQEALALNVIDIVAEDLEALLSQLDGREVIVQGQTITLETDAVLVETMQPDWRNRFLSVITDPNVAYILMLVGVYGLILEFYNPGGFIPGVAGAISLLIALYAFQVLPISYAGLGLIALGILLMTMEAFVPSTGILGIGGVIAFIVGSVILMDTESDAFQIAFPLIAAIAAFSAFLLMIVLGMVLRARRAAPVSGDNVLLSELAEAMEDFDEHGMVLVQGELWQAYSANPVRKGERLPVTAIDGLTLTLGDDAMTQRAATIDADSG